MVYTLDFILASETLGEYERDSRVSIGDRT